MPGTTFHHQKELDNSFSCQNGLDLGRVASKLRDLYIYGSSVNHPGASSSGNNNIKKKFQVKKLCLVCGDSASGHHYSVLSCEGCKGFFRRSIIKKEVYQCKYDNNCVIDMYMRRKCQQCRLKKCLKVGMRSEAKVSTTVNVVTRSARGQRKVSAVNEELINRLIHIQDEFDQPSSEDMKKISTSDIHESDGEGHFKYITEMTILTVKLTVDFSKRLPGFDSLLREDQITLLKACSSEVMMLRCARRYDAKTDSIIFANNLPYTRKLYHIAGLGDTVDSVFSFSKTLSLMKIDNAEYALLTAIDIFSERPGLVEVKKVEKIKDIYLEALQNYVKNRRLHRPMNELAKLLLLLTELRTLSYLNSKMCFSLKLKNKRLPPFLVEMWNV